MAKNRNTRKLKKNKHGLRQYGLRQYGGAPTTVGVFIGRMQPLHKGHFDTIIKGLTTEDVFVVLLGNDPFDKKNPYSIEIRKQMIIGSILETDPGLLTKLHIGILPAPVDGDDAEWSQWHGKFNSLIESTVSRFSPEMSGFLYGSGKDESTAKYLKRILQDNTFLVGKEAPPMLKNTNVMSSTIVRKIHNDFKTSGSRNFTELKEQLRPYLTDYVLNTIISLLFIEMNA